MYCVPFNQNVEIIEFYNKNKKNIKEIYIDCSYMINSFEEKSFLIFKNKIFYLLDTLDNNIEVSLMLTNININLITCQEGLNLIINFINEINNIRLNKIIISDAIMFKLINDNFKNIKISLYNAYKKHSLEEISKYYDEGLYEYHLSSSLSRNKNFIMDIKNKFPNLKLNITVNDSCDPNCVAYNECKRHKKNDKNIESFYYNYICNNNDNPLKLNFILPSEIKFYNYIDLFTIDINQNEDIIFILDKYFNENIFEYNLGKLINYKNMFLNKTYITDNRDLQIIQNCNFECLKNNCHYCDKILNNFYDLID